MVEEELGSPLSPGTLQSDATQEDLVLMLVSRLTSVFYGTTPINVFTVQEELLKNSELSEQLARLRSTTKEAIAKVNRLFINILSICFPFTDSMSSCSDIKDSYDALQYELQALSATLLNDA